MKRQIYALGIASLMIALSLTLAACGGSKGGSGETKPAPASQCSAGQVWIAQYNGCYSTAQCPVPPNPANSGWVPQVNQCIVGVPGGVTPNPTGTYHYWSGNMFITDNGRYQDLLEQKGICGGYPNWYSCSYYDNGAAVGLAVTGNAVPATGLPATVQFSSYYFNFPINGVLYAADANTNYQMNSPIAYYGSGKIFRVVARPPTTPVNLTNIAAQTQMRLELWYDNGQFGYVDAYLRY